VLSSRALALVAVLAFPLSAPIACRFEVPPPLPEELAAEEAREKEAEQARKDKEGGAGGEPATFAAGDPPNVGMTPEEMRNYATAQGDPEQGDFVLEEALANLEGDGVLWAVLETTSGAIACELFEVKTPYTVANFVGLARGLRPAKDPDSGEWVARKYYDGTSFHRVIEGFMIQAGDPTGTGMGGAGYVIPDEFDPVLRHDRAGLLSMANRGPGTGSSQFFVTLGPTPHLDGKHTVFGRCDEPSIDVAEQIAATRGPGDRPKTPQVIESVTIERRPAEAGPGAPASAQEAKPTAPPSQ